MEKLADHSPHDWIASAVRPFDLDPVTRKRGVTVGHCLPPTFDAYAKVLHPIYANPGAGDGTMWNDLRPRRTVRDRLKSLVGRGDPWERVQRSATLAAVSATGDQRQERLTWRGVADALGIEYHPQITPDSFTASTGGSWPAKYYSPSEGDLGIEFTERLARIVASHASSDAAFFYYDDITGHDDDFECTLYQGTLPELPAWLSKHEYNSPTLWWPDDHAWCVQTDEDLAFTLVGGPADLVAAILADDLLEAVSSDPDHRVDYLADTINALPQRRGPWMVR